MEANLIDRDVAEDYFGCSDWEILAKETLREVPLVSAVPVVRCRECKYQDECIRRIEFIGRNFVLEQNTYEYHPLSFCSYGQRKETDLDEAIEKYLKIKEGGQHGQAENLRGAWG